MDTRTEDMWRKRDSKLRSLACDIIYVCAQLGRREAATNEDAIQMYRECFTRTPAELEETLRYLRAELLSKRRAHDQQPEVGATPRDDARDRPF